MKTKSAGNYEKKPKIEIRGCTDRAITGYDEIIQELRSGIPAGKYVINVDTYPGVDDEELIPRLKELSPALFVDMKEIFKPEKTLREQFKYNLTDDRVFGRMYFGEVSDLWDSDAAERAVRRIQEAAGTVVVYGFGSRALYKGDLLVYCDMARWEIQMRFRRGMGNYNAGNGNEDNLRKYKRGFFIEWRVADRHKTSVFESIDYYLDTCRQGDPKMITGKALRFALEAAVCRPFRTVPYFDPGVWGGQWMKDVCGLDKEEKNFAWAFDGVPEENSLYLDFDGVIIETPAINLVKYRPRELLGEKVFARFGAEYPIRFDFLDTMGGQNLSLQVHPLTEYIHEKFGMTYTQDESYYLLDAEEGAHVYLGLKEGICPNEMINALFEAQSGKKPFDAGRFVNTFPAKKHDHFLIPAGTVHCSGAGSMVLEISATPYIFTFKLWDWGRVGLDGKPRPIHIEHGKNVIRWDRTTGWVTDNLVGRVTKLEENENYKEERTGLHELEFIETRRYWISSFCDLDTDGGVNMLNLVEGREAVVTSPDGDFDPFTVHYAETFIVPANVGKYRIESPIGERIGVVRAYVRT